MGVVKMSKMEGNPPDVQFRIPEDLRDQWYDFMVGDFGPDDEFTQILKRAQIVEGDAVFTIPGKKVGDFSEMCDHHEIHEQLETWNDEAFAKLEERE